MYCGKRSIDPLYPAAEDGINFLAELFKTGIGYSAMNTARSALSSIILLADNIPFGTHPLVCRFLKGTFVARPSLPKYNDTWDVADVFKHLITLHPAKELNLKDLTLKVTMLLMLLSGQRCQTIHALTLEPMTLTEHKCVFVIKDLLKTSRPGHHFGQLEFLAYNPDEKLCIVKHLVLYIDRTRNLRSNHQQLLISYQKPHRPVSKDTISRWIKTVLQRSGIDTAQYTAHSTRSASTSAASKSHIPLETIMSAANWTNTSTFSKFYKKPVIPKNNFGSMLLNQTYPLIV